MGFLWFKKKLLTEKQISELIHEITRKEKHFDRYSKRIKRSYENREKKIDYTPFVDGIRFVGERIKDTLQYLDLLKRCSPLDEQVINFKNRIRELVKKINELYTLISTKSSSSMGIKETSLEKQIKELEEKTREKLK